MNAPRSVAALISQLPRSTYIIGPLMPHPRICTSTGVPHYSRMFRHIIQKEKGAPQSTPSTTPEEVTPSTPKTAIVECGTMPKGLGYHAQARGEHIATK